MNNDDEKNKSIERKPYLTKTEAAKLIGVSQRTIRRWELRGQLPCCRVNQRVLRYRRCDIDDLMERMLSSGY